MSKVFSWARIAAAIAVLAGAAGFGAMEFAKHRIDLNNYRGRITGEIARTSGIQAGFARLEWLPYRPGVAAILPTLSKNGVTVSAKRLEAVISLPSLLFGPTRLSRLSIDGLALTAERDAEGRWNVEQLFAKGGKGGGMPPLPDNIILTNGSVVLSDGYVARHAAVFEESHQTSYDYRTAKECFGGEAAEHELSPQFTPVEPVGPMTFFSPPAPVSTIQETGEPSPAKLLTLRGIGLDFHGGRWLLPSSIQFKAELIDPALRRNPLYRHLKPGKIEFSLKSRMGAPVWDWNNALTKGTIAVDSVYSGSFDAYLSGLLPEYYSRKVYTFKFEFNGRPAEQLAFNGSLSARPVEQVANPELFGGPGYEPRRFIIAGGIGPKKITLDRVEIYLPQARLDVHMEVSNYRGPDPNISLRASTSFVDLDKLNRLIPPAYLNNPLLRVVRQSVGGGRFRVSGLTFNGPYSAFMHITDPENMERVSGRLEVEEASFLIKGMKQPVKGIKGVIDIKGNLLSFQNLSAIHGHSAITKLGGSISGLRTFPHLDAVLTANVDIAELREEALARIVSKKLDEIIEPVRDLGGTVHATVNVQVDLLDQRITDLDANIQFTNAGFRHDQFKVPVSGFNGLFHVTPDDIEIKDAAFNVEGSAITFGGAIHRYGEPDYDIDLKIEIAGGVPGMAENPLLAEQLRETFTGNIVGNLAISGTLDNLAFFEELNLTQAKVKLFGIIDKPPSQPLKISTKGTLQGGDRLVIDEGHVNFGNSHIRFRGTVPNAHSWKGYNFTANVDTVDLADGPIYIKDFRQGVVTGKVNGEVRITDNGKEPAASGTLNVKIGNIDLGELEHLKQTFPPFGYVKLEGKVNGDVTVRFSPGELPKLNGWLNGKDVGFYTLLPNKFRNLNGTVKLKGNMVTFAGIPFTSGNTTAEASGSLLIQKKPVLRLDIRAKRIDLADTVWFEGAPDPWWTEGNQFSPELIIRARSRSGMLDFIHYKDIDLDMHYYRDRFTFKSVRFGVYEGLCDAMGEINIEPDKPLFSTKLKLTGVELEPLIKDFWPNMKKVTGKLTTDGTYTGEGLRWEQFRHTLDGTMRFEAEDGLISQFAGMANIFSAINVAPLLEKRAARQEGSGLPYTGITGTMKIKKGTGHTDDLVMEGRVVRMSASGDFHFNDGTIKLFLGVKPFTSVDTIISHIPVAGPLLTGDQKSLIISYYDLSGPMDGPVATAVPGESVARAILGIFQRALEAPARALSTEKGLESLKEKQSEKVPGKN